MFVNKNLLTRVPAIRVQKEGGNLHLRVEDEAACCRHCTMRRLKRLACVVSTGRWLFARLRPSSKELSSEDESCADDQRDDEQDAKFG